jgi:hypothetical protein
MKLNVVDVALPLIGKMRDALPPTATPFQICMASQMLLIQTMHYDFDMSDEDSNNFMSYMAQVLNRVMDNYHAKYGSGCKDCQN